MSDTGNYWNIIVISVICLLIGLCAPALAEEKKISPDNGGTHLAPQISWNSVVWYDINSNQGIYVYDLCTGTVSKVSGSAAVDPDNARVSGDIVVWTDYRNTDPLASTFTIDLDEGTERKMESQSGQLGYLDQWNPSISGKTVVFTQPTPNADGAGTQNQLYTYDLGSGDFRLISQIWTYGGVTNERSRIYGTRIVWSDQVNLQGKYRIWLYDLATGDKKAVSPENRDAINPDINGKYIVWEELADMSRDMGDIVLYEIDTGTMTKIAENTGRNPAVFGHRVVWEDDRDYQSTGTDIWRYDTISKTTKQITANEYDQKSPGVSSKNIVWQDERDGVHIYLSDDRDVETLNDALQAPNSLTCMKHTIPIVRIFLRPPSIFPPLPQPTVTPVATEPTTPSGGGATQPLLKCSCTPPQGAPPLTVTCDSAGTPGSDGNAPAVMTWRFGDNTIQTGAKVTHTYQKSGTYTVTAGFKEQSGNEKRGTCAIIEVKGQGTSAGGIKCSCTPLSGKSPLTVTCDSAGSAGSDGNAPAVMTWRFGDGTLQTGAKVTHTYQKSGTYTVTAGFKEQSGNEKSATCASINVGDSGEGASNPSCMITAGMYFSTTPTTWGDKVTIRGIEDHCDAGLKFTLQKKPIPAGQEGPGGFAIGTAPPSTAGYVFVVDTGAAQQQYSLTDGEYVVFIANAAGKEYTKVAFPIGTPSTTPPTTTPTTSPPNKAPVAVIAASPSSGSAPLTVSFDASKSNDSDGKIVSYNWAFAKTALGSGKTVSHTFTAAGTYTVTLMVKDDDGAVGTATKTITVSAPTVLSHQ